MRKNKKYFLALFLILFWWGLTLIPYQKEISNPFKRTTFFWKHQKEALSPLSFLSRKDIKKALQGDVPLLLKLLKNYEEDALYLQKLGFSPFDLSSHAYGEIESIKKTKSFAFSHPKKLKFLPQTYASATILLSLVPPSQIVAIPKGLRSDTSLFPASTFEEIPLNIDRYHSEKLFLAKPDLALVASYSDPATLQALEAQGIPLFYLDTIQTFNEIADSILRMGEMAGVPDKGKLLFYFLHSTYFNILNRFLLLEKYNPVKKSALYLKYYDSLSVPSKKALSTQLLDMLNFKNSAASKIEKKTSLWSLPFSFEEIVSLDPDIIFFSSPIKEIESTFKKEKALQNTKAIEKKAFFILDEIIQNSPTQFIVLALYDLSLLEPF